MKVIKLNNNLWTVKWVNFHAYKWTKGGGVQIYVFQYFDIKSFNFFQAICARIGIETTRVRERIKNLIFWIAEVCFPQVRE